MSPALIWPVAALIGLIIGSASWKLREHGRKVDALAAIPEQPAAPSPDEIAALMEPLAADLAEQYAEAIETLRPPPCPHKNNRPSCGPCGESRTVDAAAALVREMGGVQQ